MTVYGIALSVHVVTAIFGLGQFAGLLVLATPASAEANVEDGVWTALGRLARGGTLALVLMLLSGVFLEYRGGGAFHESWWFRLSFLAMLILGATTGRLRVAIRRRAEVGAPATLKRVRLGGWVLCLVTAFVAVLMETKPF